MQETDLRTYTSRIVELEAAIYTQKKLMEEHGVAMQRHRPVEPTKRVPAEPKMPKQSDFEKRYVSSTFLNIASVIAIVVSIAMVITSIVVVNGFDAGYLIWFALGLFGAFYLIGGFQERRRGRKQSAEKYNIAKINYDRDYKDWIDRRNIVNQQHEKAVENYRTQLGSYTIEERKITTQHKDTLAALEAALQVIYDEGVIFPKYRNMVAITTINEYLMSGRCSELEGPNGAYNLYEMELRQNIIISQLTNIISNLEQIRDGQYMLYQELLKANATVSDILREVQGVNESSKLTAYFAGVTALIEASPKVTIGRIY